MERLRWRPDDPEDAATPVVILHSNGMCAPFYRPVGELLAARGFDVTAFTLPGFDGTEALPDRSLPALVEAIAPEVLEALGEGGILVGHSLGGMLAFLLAARPDFEDRVQRLVLLEPAIVPVRALTSLFAGWYRRGAVEGEPGFRNRGPFFWRLHDPDRYPQEAWTLFERNERETDPAVVRGLLATSDQVLPLPFERVACPVILVRGRSSGPVMWAAQRLLARRFPHARCVDLERAGHWMVFEADDALAAAIATL